MAIAEHVLPTWLPRAQLEGSPLLGGRSGAAVLRLDVRGEVPVDMAGVYALKLECAERGSGAARGEELAVEHAPLFAQRHVPRVVKAWSGTLANGAGSAVLYELAGGSLVRYTTGGRRGSTPLLQGTRTITATTLAAWSKPADIVDGRPLDLLTSVVGEEGADEALTIASDFFGAAGIRYEHGHVFLSPVGLLADDSIRIPLIRSFQHGDLHTGNLLLPIDQPEDRGDFWVIDFDRAGVGYAGLDLAYLELSVVLDFFDDMPPSALARCLDHVEFPHRNFPVPDDLHWLAGFMRASRDAALEYASSLAGRRDDLERQFLVARVAEALRWSLRHRGRRKSTLALMYAGWYAAHYDRLYSTANALALHEVADPLVTPSITSAERDVFDEIWSAAGHFARRDWIYVLVAERLTSGIDAGSLGNLPWSAIVDLDPNSDHDGLYSQAGPVLASTRAVHVYSEERPATDTRRGALWLMSGGWRLRREPHLDFRHWVRTRLKVVRSLFESVRRATGDQHVMLIAVIGDRSEHDAHGAEDRLVRVLEAFDETWEGRGAIHVIGDSEPHMLAPATFYPLRVAAFANQLAATLGSTEWGFDYQLPSGGGEPLVVHHDTMRVLQEHFDVLHDRVAASGSDDEAGNDSFWRGGQVLWSDLAEGLDVPRAVAADLSRALLESLDGHRTRTVVLQHRPGAGGTTAARRAAWDVHLKYPVAVLRGGRALTPESVRLLADRLQRIFVLTDLPVLFVADSGDMPEAYREALYRELAARNARITTLYVRRSLAPNPHQLSVSDPLTDDEGRHFLARYRQLTSDESRAAELEVLGTDAYQRYRTPFFYGLITFQRDFQKIGDYVGHHLRDVAGRARDVLAHLSLVSLYSNSGLQLGLLQRLFRLTVGAEALTLEDLLGSAAPLVVQRGGRYRVAHQLLAEEILAHLVGTEWRLHLSDLALDLIEDVCGVGDTSSEPLRLLFRQIFIDRVSGVVDGVEDRGEFAPIVAELDSIDPSIGHQVLYHLAQNIPDEPHFWNHLGRHQVYRLRRDLDLAEHYLEAAIDLSPGDSLHHHTLGLARRGRLRQGLRSAEGQGAEAVMAVVEAWFSRTVECFERARAISPDDIYGYITHVQTVLEAARAIRSAARADTIADLRSTAGEWIAEQLTVANGLLDDAVQLYGTLERHDDYLRQCLADIHRLYGDLDGVVRLWELDQASGRSTPFSRRALAQAYFVRAKRSWRGLTSAELSRVASLAEDNLRRTSAREEDYRLWFEARKLLPDFDVEQAIAHLELWSARLPTWRAAYYRYVLHFLLWFSQRSDDTRAMEAAQEECARLSPGRLNHSHAWLARDPRWCPLVADSDLGEWDRRMRFWSDTSLLQRTNGVIDIIDGPASGTILIGDRRAHAFFVPVAGGFLANADENSPVNFFLGFSPSGLRAWDVLRGHDEQAASRVDAPMAQPAFVSRPRHLDYEGFQARRTSALRFGRIRELTRVFLEAAGARGADVRLDWLEERLLATLGLSSLDDVQKDAVARAVESLPSVTLHASESGQVVRRRELSDALQPEPTGVEHGFVSWFDRSSRWGKIAGPAGPLTFSFDDVDNPEALLDLRRHAVVQYIRSSERRNERGLHVRILGDRVSLFGARVIEPNRLGEVVAGETRRFLEEALAQDRATVPVSELEDHLERTFRGAVPLGPRLGETGLRAYFRSLPWMAVRGPAGAQTAALLPGAPFGTAREARSSTAQGALRTDDSGERDVTPAEVLRQIIRHMHAEGHQATLQSVGSTLKSALGESAYAAFVGASGLRRVIERLNWSTQEVRPGVIVVINVSPDDIAQVAGAASALKTVVEQLEAAGLEPNLQRVGPRLKAALGEAAYVSFTNRSLKRAINGLPGWRTEEARPGVDVAIHEKGSAGDAVS